MLVCKLRFLQKQDAGYLFYSTETLSTDQLLVLKATIGQCIDTVRELDAMAERYIWETVHKDCAATTDFNRKLLVIDVSDYPYVSAYLDDRDQTPDNAQDQFEQDVYQAWLQPFDATRVPTIVVNSKLPFTGLKFISTLV